MRGGGASYPSGFSHNIVTYVLLQSAHVRADLKKALILNHPADTVRQSPMMKGQWWVLGAEFQTCETGWVHIHGTYRYMCAHGVGAAQMGKGNDF